MGVCTCVCTGEKRLQYQDALNHAQRESFQHTHFSPGGLSYFFYFSFFIFYPLKNASDIRGE